MTPRERVWSAIRHEQPDVVPWNFFFTVPMREKMAAYYGDPDFEERLGNHLLFLTIASHEGREEVAPDFWRDDFGVVWNRTVDKDIGVVAEYRLQEPSLANLRLPYAMLSQRLATFPQAIAAHPDRFVVGCLHFSFFERAWSFRGMQQMFLDMKENPGFVDEFLDTILAFNLTAIRQAAQHDIDAIYFGDDWGQQHGLLMGPQLWRRFIKPRLAQQYAAVKAAGKAVMIHCCGDITEIFDDLIEIGVDVYNPFQPEVMDVYAVKRRFGDRISFYGGMGVQSILPHGTPQEVAAEARRMAREIGRNGGYILSPSHEVPGDVPVENMLAFIETAQNQ